VGRSREVAVKEWEATEYKVEFRKEKVKTLNREAFKG
jgi:hypothetical protein